MTATDSKPTIRTYKQALAKAKVIWGKMGYVKQADGTGLGLFRVGYVSVVCGIPMFHVEGQGDSFDAAFADVKA